MIYIIDDDKYVLRGFQMLLRSAGLESRVYDGANDFIQSWLPGVNDILILDMHMTGINGCDLLDYLEAKTIHIPVIVVTAFDEEASRRRSASYGALAYLTKPVDSERLMDLIQNQIDNKKEYSGY